jgi:hypothetical protein
MQLFNMYRIISVIIFSLGCLHLHAQDPEKWPAIKQADAQNLAKAQGDVWKKSFQSKNILMGLGPNGPDKLKELLNSSDANSKSLLDLVLKSADASLLKPMPEYKNTAQAVNGGMTATVAGNEEWLRPLGDQMVLLSVAARVSSNPAYKQRLHDLVVALCKYPTWGSRPRNADLAAGHVSRGIAMAWNWNPDLWTGTERKMVIDSVRSKVNMLCQGIYSTYWAGMYTANHNHVSTNGAGFCGLAFINDIPEAKEWLAAAWLNFNEVVKRCYADGGSSEGTAYFSATVSFIVQYIEAMNGVLPSRTLYDSPFLKNASDYRTNNATPGFTGVICWGDSYPQDFSGPEHYLLRLSSQYNDEVARFTATHTIPGTGGGEDVKAWAWLWSLPVVGEKAPTQLDYYATVADMINSRSGWKNDDYVFSLKSGYTNRSHSHLEAGAFALIAGNDWLLPTAGYGKGKVNGDYWDKANGRWQYQSTSTEANSTIVINQQQQRHDSAARGTIDHFSSYGNAMTAECDLSKAYDGVLTMRRRIFHRRGEYIIVQDAVSLKEQGQVEWLLQTPPNAVVNDNIVNIQGKTASVTINLLSPKTTFSLREGVSPKKDLPSVRKTLSASISGKNAGFIAVIEPSIHGHEQTERTYTVTDDNVVEIKSAGAEERLFFSGRPVELKDKETSVSAIAGFMYIKTEKNKLAEIILTDATKVSAGIFQLTSGSVFNGQLVKADGKNWNLEISSGKDISFKGTANVFKINDGKRTPVSGQINGAGNYIIE